MGNIIWKNKNKNNFQITDVVEKPKISEGQTNYAIIGRYILVHP